MPVSGVDSLYCMRLPIYIYACMYVCVGACVCVSYVLSLSGALVRTLCTKPVRLAICFSIASIRSLLKKYQ